MIDLIAMLVTSVLFLGTMTLLAKKIAPRYKREIQEKRQRDALKANLAH